MTFILSLLLAFCGFAEDTGGPRPKEQQYVEKEARQQKLEAAGQQPNILDERDKFEFLKRQDDLDIMRHKPIYFAYSNPLSKLQFSFKAPIIEDVPLYFAYSQIIFWKLLADSKPFLDATYNPEFFYRFKWPASKKYNIDFGMWEHNSNGKGGTASRSYDQTYVRGNYYFEFPSWVVVVSAKLRYIYNVDDFNKDILDYIGPADFELRFIQLFRGWVDKGELTVELNPGGHFADKFNKGGLQLGYNFRLGGLHVVPAFYVQYFTGYGETLINYNQRVQQFRVGFLF